MTQVINIYKDRIKRCLLSEVRPYIKESKEDSYIDINGKTWTPVDDESKIAIFYNCEKQNKLSDYISEDLKADIISLEICDVPITSYCDETSLNESDKLQENWVAMVIYNNTQSPILLID